MIPVNMIIVYDGNLFYHLFRYRYDDGTYLLLGTLCEKSIKCRFFFDWTTDSPRITLDKQMKMAEPDMHNYLPMITYRLLGPW